MTYFKTYYWWLGMLLLLVSYLPFLLADKAAFKRLSDFSFISIRGKWFSFVMIAFYAVFAIVPFFVRLTDSIALLMAGCLVFGFGAVCTLVSYDNYFSSKSDETITKGLYRFSRNAIYVSALFFYGNRYRSALPLVAVGCGIGTASCVAPLCHFGGRTLLRADLW